MDQFALSSEEGDRIVIEIAEQDDWVMIYLNGEIAYLTLEDWRKLKAGVAKLSGGN